ncbi:Uncharacterised protein [Yersinia intermedia]|uniref:Uncharacterized protein n=1 Tax=Yersinia intermedia TaxID=631 RepID=A0A0H5LTM8_YERIN|nr:Uncharacterised protein [Yersinia intermedia]
MCPPVLRIDLIIINSFSWLQKNRPALKAGLFELLSSDI